MDNHLDHKKENQILITLAIKARLIKENKRQEILSKIIEKSQTDPKCSVIDIFLDEKILSNEEIEFLFALKRHLKIKMLDKRFGQLGVVNHFLTPQDVEDALNLQDTYFRTNKKSKKIGDILVEGKKISPANKTAILLTQNRIQDHLLEQAINDIGRSEIEKIKINMRFGAIAVKKEFISIDQLNHALKIQKSEVTAGKEKRYLGEIFKELFALSEEDILSILKIQKEIEKKRLALEKALNHYNSEISTINRLNSLFEVILSKDRMEAYLQCKKESFEEIKIDHFKNWLKLNGIQFGIVNNALIESFISDSDVGASLKIAQGKPPKAPRDEIIEFLFDTTTTFDEKSDPDKRKPTVKAGEILANITQQYKEGVPGMDVLGYVVQPPAPRMQPLICGKGVTKKAGTFIAQIDGRPVLFKQRSLFIEPMILKRDDQSFTGSISNNTEKKYSGTNLTLEGSVTDKGVLSCHHATIMGDVFGTIHSTGNLEIKGQIGDEGILQTRIQSQGDIFVSKQIINSQVSTLKGLTAPKSNIFNSEIYAMQNIIINSVHSTADNLSVLQVGVSRNFRLDEINRSIDEEMIRLRQLTMQDEQDTLSLNLQKKINIQNEFVKKQNVLVYLLKALQSKALKHIQDIEQKIQVFESIAMKGQKLTTRSPSDVWPGRCMRFHGRGSGSFKGKVGKRSDPMVTRKIKGGFGFL